MIPTCDDPDALPGAITSVLDQAPGPDEMQIEVVDDCSTTVDVAALVREVAGDRVAVFSHPARVGAPANFTACVARSRGELVHILHADDLVLPGFYAAYDEHLRRHPAGMAVSRTWFIDADGERHGLSGPLPERDGCLVDAERVLALDNPVNFVSVVVERSVYEAVGGFDERLVHANDWEMWTRIAHAHPVAVVAEGLAAYRVHGGSDTTRLQRSMVYLADPIAAARTITARIDDPAVRREVRRHIDQRLAAHALAVGSQQADAHEHRLAATSALRAVRLSPDRATVRMATGIVRRAVRNRLR